MPCYVIICIWFKVWKKIGGLRRSPLLCVQVLQLRVKDTCRCALLMLRHAVPCYLDITCFGLVVFWEMFLLHSIMLVGVRAKYMLFVLVLSFRLPLWFDVINYFWELWLYCMFQKCVYQIYLKRELSKIQRRLCPFFCKVLKRVSLILINF